MYLIKNNCSVEFVRMKKKNEVENSEVMDLISIKFKLLLLKIMFIVSVINM